MYKFGLLGKNISYSFSKNYFQEKFRKLRIEASYINFDLQDISDITTVLQDNPELKGLNVTIPYKEQVIPFLDELDETAEEIGAVNTIRFLPNGKLKGFNTDFYGFRESLVPFLKAEHEKALILGTGGASKAVYYALETLDIQPVLVSRTPQEGQLTYNRLTKEIIEEHTVIINCTPLGTYPNTGDAPEIPFQFLRKEHLVFDLIYNPTVTKLMELAASEGAIVSNGLKMLELQAEKAWEIWNT